ncbi:VG15 protein [Rhodococcus sp. NPDC003348]
MSTLPLASADHYREQQQVTRVVLAAAQAIWGTRAPADFDSWFDDHVDQLTGLLTAGQRRAAAGADEYVATTLEELGTPVSPDVEIDPTPLFGVASDGRPLGSLLYGAVIRTKAAVAASSESNTVAASQAWNGPGLHALLERVQVQVADADRAATGMAIAARDRVGYVRMVNPPSCARCAVLAGRWYRYNTGFRRHPQCDCRHIPSREDTADDLRTDPRGYFDSLSVPQQDKIFTIAGAQAIRDGADISQVVNARRGMDIAGGRPQPSVYGRELLTTTEGVTKRGIAGGAIRARGRNARTTPRLMPEAIYEIAESREEALRLLQMNGYVAINRPMSPSIAARASAVKVTPKPLTPAVAGGPGGPGGPSGPRTPTAAGDFPDHGRALDDLGANAYRTRQDRRDGHRTDSKADNDWRYIRDPDDRATAILQYVRRDRTHVVQVTENLAAGRDPFDSMDFTSGTLAERVNELGYGSKYGIDDYRADLHATAARLLSWSRSPSKASGVVYRGLRFEGITPQEALARYTVGEVETWRYAATSPQLTEALEYARRANCAPVMWNIAEPDGIALSPVGRMIDSEEFIVTGRVRVDSVTLDKYGTVQVEGSWVQ